MNARFLRAPARRGPRLAAAPWTAFVLFAALIALAAAPGGSLRVSAGEEAEGVRVVTTSFPTWLFTRNLLAGLPQFVIDPILPRGEACPHEVEYSAAEQRRLLSAHAVVVNGLGEDQALLTLLASLPRSARVPLVFDASSRAGLPDAAPWIPERASESFALNWTASPPPAVRRPNPHYFASPVEAARTVRSLARAFMALPGMSEPRARQVLESNRDRYAQALDDLAGSMRETVRGFGNRRIATQHDAFAYFARDLDLRIVAVIADRPEREPTPAELRGLFERIAKRGAGAIFLEPGGDDALGENVAEATRLPVGHLDPVASGPIAAPLDYYENAMGRNLIQLTTHLRDAPPPPENADPDPENLPPARAASRPLRTPVDPKSDASAPAAPETPQRKAASDRLPGIAGALTPAEKARAASPAETDAADPAAAPATPAPAKATPVVPLLNSGGGASGGSWETH